MDVRHLTKLHPRGILLSELRVFFIRPWCSQAGIPGCESAIGERKSLLAAWAGNRPIYAPLDHLNVLGEPAFDYFIPDPE
jgi:hypothetical protein